MFLMAMVLMIMVVECQGGQDINHDIMVWHHTRYS